MRRSQAARRIVAQDIQWEMAAPLSYKNGKPTDGSDMLFSNDIRLVIDGSKFVGWIRHEFEPPQELLQLLCNDTEELAACSGEATIPWGERVKNKIHPLTQAIQVRFDTPVVDLPTIMSTHASPVLFVTDDSQITGVIDFADLLGPVALLVWMALTLDLESATLELLCRLKPDNPFDMLRVLPEERRLELVERFRFYQTDFKEPEDISVEYARQLIRQILQYAMLCDKRDLLIKLKALPDVSNSKIRQTFKNAERLRDLAAHPAAYDAWQSGLLPKEFDVEDGLPFPNKFTADQIAAIVHDIRTLTDSIYEYTDMPDTKT